MEIQTGEKSRGEVDVPHPLVSAHFSVHACRHVSSNAAGESVQNAGSRVHTAMVMSLEQPHQSYNHNS